MLDLSDRFVNWLMIGFYNELKQDVTRYALNLAKAMEENDTENIDLYLNMIKDTREILDDISDENMDFKDFVHLILGKYHLVTD